MPCPKKWQILWNMCWSLYRYKKGTSQNTKYYHHHVLINISGKLYHLIHSEFKWNNISDYYTEMNINNCVFWHINIKNKNLPPSPQIGLKWQTSHYIAWQCTYIVYILPDNVHILCIYCLTMYIYCVYIARQCTYIVYILPDNVHILCIYCLTMYIYCVFIAWQCTYIVYILPDNVHILCIYCLTMYIYCVYIARQCTYIVYILPDNVHILCIYCLTMYIYCVFIAWQCTYIVYIVAG